MNEFEINIAHKYTHWGRVILSSHDREADAVEKVKFLRQLFSVEEGYEVSLSQWNRVGRTIDV